MEAVRSLTSQGTPAVVKKLGTAVEGDQGRGASARGRMVRAWPLAGSGKRANGAFKVCDLQMALAIVRGRTPNSRTNCVRQRQLLNTQVSNGEKAFLRVSGLPEVQCYQRARWDTGHTSTFFFFFVIKKEDIFDTSQTMTLQLKITALGRRYFQGCQFL